MGMVEELERAQLRAELEERRCGALMYADDFVLVENLRMELQTIGGSSSLHDEVEDEV